MVPVEVDALVVAELDPAEPVGPVVVLAVAAPPPAPSEGEGLHPVTAVTARSSEQANRRTSMKRTSGGMLTCGPRAILKNVPASSASQAASIFAAPLSYEREQMRRWDQKLLREALLMKVDGGEGPAPDLVIERMGDEAFDWLVNELGGGALTPG